MREIQSILGKVWKSGQLRECHQQRHKEHLCSGMDIQMIQPQVWMICFKTQVLGLIRFRCLPLNFRIYGLLTNSTMSYRIGVFHQVKGPAFKIPPLSVWIEDIKRL